MMTAPTKGWSSTQRVAMLAMLFPCRSPMVRKTDRSDWNNSHEPHAFTIMSRYYALEKKLAEDRQAEEWQCAPFSAKAWDCLHTNLVPELQATCQPKIHRTGRVMSIKPIESIYKSCHGSPKFHRLVASGRVSRTHQTYREVDGCQ